MAAETTLKERFPVAKFDVRNLEDEIRADQLCTDLLKSFAEVLIELHKLDPLEAGTLAHGADLFLRDFLIADRHDNIFRPHPQRVRQFAGNWYILKTLEPNTGDIARQLDAIRLFYRFFADEGLVAVELAEALAVDCDDLAYYTERIESFWSISGDGFHRWNAACPIRDEE